uniref:Retrovirus-related Pol polyprotein from transposon TNT 1-94 n=1 Tax=Tanacetum cinerariifolium TaxID=118510 RepID=A0A6L2N1B5_TANCI|nr:retrovirus-related Pol polyprotein from transposon TNT 1-94 [Tanacetum cinerariifolium]
MDQKKSSDKVSQTYVIKKKTEPKHPTVQISCPDKNALPSTEQLLLTLMKEVKDSNACFYAKASPSVNWLWHKRLSHLNFKTVNNLAKHNLVSELPPLTFLKDKNYSACEKRKHHIATFKTKRSFSINKCLHLLYMDLFGLVNPQTISHNKYTLVIINEYSRYTWVFCLKKKSDATDCIMSFIIQMENLNNTKVKQLRSDNGTEFKNHTLEAFCDEKAYEVFRGRVPDISYFHAFGCPVHIHNHRDHLGKFDEKADDGFFLKYSLVAKAFMVFNIRRQDMEETFHITFSEDDEAISLSKTEGFQIKQDSRGISIFQEKYVKDLLKIYDLADCASMKCPMLPPNNLGPDESRVSVNETQYQANPKESHLVVVKRIFRYLKGTSNLGLWYLKRSCFDLKAYSDSDYAECILDRKTEAEYVAAAGCCAQVLWIKSQLADYDVLYNKLHPETGKHERKPNIRYTRHLSLIMEHLMKENYKNGKLLSLKPYKITDVTLKTPLEGESTLMAHMCNIISITPKPLQSLIPLFRELNADNNADKKMNSSSKTTHLQAIKELVVTADPLKSIETSESVEVLNTIMEKNVEEKEDADEHSLEIPTVEQLLRKLISITNLFKRPQRVPMTQSQKSRSVTKKVQVRTEEVRDNLQTQTKHFTKYCLSLHNMQTQLQDVKNLLESAVIIDETTEGEKKKKDDNETHAPTQGDLAYKEATLLVSKTKVNKEIAIVLHDSERKNLVDLITTDQDSDDDDDLDKQPLSKRFKIMHPIPNMPKPLMKIVQHQPLADLKEHKKKLEEELKKLLNPTTFKAQALKWEEHEEKKANMLNEFNKCIFERANPLPITKISYVVKSSKTATMRITRDKGPSKPHNKSYDVLLQSLKTKFQWVLTQAKKLGLPPPPKLATFGLTAKDKKRKRMEIFKDVFMTKNIIVDGMHRNLIPPPEVVPIKGLVINKPESGIFFMNRNTDIAFQREKIGPSFEEPLSAGLKNEENQLSGKHELAVKGLSECKALESNIIHIQVKDIVKEVKDYLKTYSSAGMDISWHVKGIR